MASTTIFLSSTRKDLLPYVEAVDRALRAQPGWELTPVRNEYWGALPEAPAVASLQAVERADLFVGIYGWRYGHVPQGAKTSITEQELEKAVQEEKPIFCYLVADSALRPHDLPPEPEESLRLLARLKDRLLEDFVVAPFSDPQDLARRVAKDLSDRLALEALLTEKRGLLRRLWKTVKSSWIEGVLRPSVPAGRWVAIARQERPEAVGRVAPPRHHEAGTDLPIGDLFQRANCRLLVLGPPAGGKTTELLKLAAEEGKLAWGSAKARIPVVFHLGSWHERAPLEKWMADQLSEQYWRARPDAEALVVKDVLPLLDALDEVPADCREDCVAAIDGYLRDHDSTMVVCCQTQVYREELPPLKGLQSAVALLPLTLEQVDSHLAARGPELAGLRAAVADSAELQRLAESPLLLRRLEEIYGGRPAEEIRLRRPEELAEKWVEHALEPRTPFLVEQPPPRRQVQPPWRRWRPRPEGSSSPPPPRYAPAAVRRALAWLARHMVSHHRPLFQVERLQPSWLEMRRQLWAYTLASRAAGGLLLALPLAYLFRRTGSGLGFDLLAFGLTGGVFAGAVDALVLQRHARPVPARTRRRRYGRAALRALLVAAGVASGILLLGPVWLRLAPTGNPGADAGNLLLAAGLLAPLLGGTFGFRTIARDRKRDIRIGSALEWTRWSWRGVALGAALGLLTGCALAVVGLLDPTLVIETPAVWLVFPAGFGMVGATGGGALAALGLRPLERRVSPNKGTWLALRNAGVVALCFALATAVICLLFLVVFAWKAWHLPTLADLTLALAVGLTAGYWVGLAFSGLDFLQHFTLRGLLALSAPVPARLVEFLDYATERGLLKRTGGSYEFYDLYLRRYFAELREDEGAGRRVRSRRRAARVPR